MKTYYDLTSKEKKEYLKEFRKTTGGKDIFIGQIIINALFAFLAGFFTGFYYECGYLLIILFPIVYNVYVDILFSCWLKNKYDIKRW